MMVYLSGNIIVPDLSSDIAEQVLEPITSTADGQSATGRGIDELIRADQYLALKAAIGNRRRGLYITKLSTQGAAGRGCSSGGWWNEGVWVG